MLGDLYRSFFVEKNLLKYRNLSSLRGIEHKESEMNVSVRAVIWTSVLFSLLLICPGCQKQGGIGSKAPDFSLYDLSGREISLKQHRGSVVLLDFWATWCKPCRVTIPELTRLQKKYRDRGLVVLSISMDDPLKFTDDYLRAFKEKFGISYKVLRYQRQVLEDYFRDEQIAIPTLFLIDREGNIKKKIVGFRPELLRKSVSGLLG